MSTFPRLLAAFASLPLLLGAAALHASDFPSRDDPFKSVREQFRSAYALAAASGTESQYDSEALKTYPLYPYLQAARIRRALPGTAPGLISADERAATFLSYYDREPVAHELRRAWLENLATRRQWAAFLEHYRDEVANDDLRCYSFSARIELGRTEGLVEDIAAQWLTPRSIMPCDQAFKWLRAQNALTPALIEQRVRLALRERNISFARTIAGTLPQERAAPLLQWAALLENPQRGIDGLIANPDRSVDDEALLAAWTRYARANRDGAMERYDRLVRARRFDAQAASPYAAALALPLSWARHPGALKYFQRVTAEHLDDYVLEWQARAALWAEDWALVQRSIAAMSGEQRQGARWRYWSARAAEQTRNLPLARQLFTSILADDNYYSAMAAARLGRPVVPNAKPLPVDTTRLTEISQLPPLVRARELLLCDLRIAAVAEWHFSQELLSEEARMQAIHLAVQWGWYDLAVATATRHRIFNDYPLLYPRPFDDEVARAAQLAELPPELIYAVMRQESLYRTDAVSSAGALGLLQMLPETARRTAAAWKKPRPSRTDLFDPAVNISLGAAHLRDLTNRFGGQTIVALAGYNAGPGAAVRWLPARALDADVWIENIPFNETRAYVQRILWHSVVFAWLRTGEPQVTDAWIARVGPLSDPAVLGMTGAPEERAFSQ